MQWISQMQRPMPSATKKCFISLQSSLVRFISTCQYYNPNHRLCLLMSIKSTIWPLGLKKCSLLLDNKHHCYHQNPPVRFFCLQPRLVRLTVGSRVEFFRLNRKRRLLINFVGIPWSHWMRKNNRSCHKHSRRVEFLVFLSRQINQIFALQ